MSLRVFLGNHKAENYRDMVADLVQCYKAMGCNMSLKVNFLDSRLEKIWGQWAMSTESDVTRTFPPFQNGTRHVQSSMQADYCWTLRRDVAQAKYSRKLFIVTFYVMYILSVLKCKDRFSSQFNRALLKNLCLIERTNNIFEISARSSIGFTQPSQCDKI
jgi:hypothetical protein